MSIPRPPAGAPWHLVGKSSYEEKLSPRSNLSKQFQAPARAPAVRPSESQVAKIGNMRRPPRKSTNPVRPKGRTWRDITAGDAVDYGYKAWLLAKRISTLINVEEKVHDVDGTSGTTVTTTATVVNLSNIAQGSDYFNRIGDSILGQSMEFRARVVGNTASPRHVIRILLVADREQNGTDPVIGEVLQAGTSPVIQPYNVFYTSRFNVLYDELVHLNNAVGLATGGTSTTYLSDQEHLPMMARKWNRHVKYDAAAAADASNRENALYLMAISADATDGPSLTYTFRFRFTDN
jgi:hypothetical protein